MTILAFVVAMIALIIYLRLRRQQLNLSQHQPLNPVYAHTPASSFTSSATLTPAMSTSSEVSITITPPIQSPSLFSDSDSVNLFHSTLTPAAAAAVALNEKEKDTVPFESFSLNELKKETLSPETSLTAATSVDREEVVTPKSVILSKVKKETSHPFEEESKSVELEIEEEVGPVIRSMSRKRLQMN